LSKEHKVKKKACGLKGKKRIGNGKIEKETRKNQSQTTTGDHPRAPSYGKKT